MEHTFLLQFSLTIKHIPGIRNELCDWLSRGKFEELTSSDLDSLAKEAFERMDVHLDFAILFKLTEVPAFSQDSYLQSEWKEAWLSLDPGKAQLVNELLLYHNESILYCEGKRVVPKASIAKCLS